MDNVTPPLNGLLAIFESFHRRNDMQVQVSHLLTEKLEVLE
jgi:hypothetical protein